MIWIFWLAFGFLCYPFVGYPLLLWVLSLVWGREHQQAPIRPSVSIIIAVFNGEKQIAAKLSNTLELDYPENLLEILVASDGSNDRTAEIVKTFSDRGVKLVEIPERRGKHYAQMVARDASRGEILVFTDVSVILGPEALQRIVSNFADSAIGCVSSEDRELGAMRGFTGEGAYLRFDQWLRRLESRLSSVVSLSGSFFAARRQVCTKWHPRQSSDFFIALHSVTAGLRAIVDPESHGWYSLRTGDRDEFSRKVRTVVHGLDVFFTHLEVLNPFRYGLFPVNLISHKFVRWVVPFALLGLLVSNIFLCQAGLFYQLCLMGQGLALFTSLLGLIFSRLQEFRLIRLAVYFTSGNLATVSAWIKFCGGVRFASWEPTQRA